MTIRQSALAALIGILLATSGARAADLMVLDGKIPLGEVKGRIDHLAIDPGRKRLIVAELGNDSVGVVDLAGQKVAGRISGLREPQGVAYVASSDLIFVADAGDGSVRWFKAADLSPVGRLELGDDADNIRVDPKANQVIVGYGKGGLATLDASSRRKLGDIKLPAHPESFQLEQQGSRAFVNLPDAHRVAVVDRATGRQSGEWTYPKAGGNFPMALDEASHRLLVAYRNSPVLVVFDTETGALLSQMRSCADADDVFLDAKRRRVYVSCGEGVVGVFEKDGGGYREAGTVRTSSGARTSLFDPDLDRLYLAVRATGSEPAAIWVYRPAS